MKYLLIVLMLAVMPVSAFDVVTFEVRSPGWPDEIRFRCKTTLEPNLSRVAVIPKNVKVAVFNKNMNDGDSITCNSIARRKLATGEYGSSVPSKNITFKYIAAQFKNPDSPKDVIYVPVSVK